VYRKANKELYYYYIYLSPEVGKVTLKCNGDEALNDEFLFKSNGDEALNDVFP
jgi:hypothetical protein